MELKIIEQTPQESLKRTTIHARVFADAQSPSRQVIADALAEELDVKRDLVVVHKILPAFGDKSAEIHARVYTDAEVMKTLERENLLEKNKKVEAKPAEDTEEASE
jgi:ribosomal protein S24E